MNPIFNFIKIHSSNFWKTLKEAGSEFVKDNGLKLSASLSYYTIFSLCPTLIIIISLCGWFYGQEAIEGKIYHQIKGIVGSNAAVQIQEIIKNVRLSDQSIIATVIGIATLIIGSTGVFLEIQESINYIWSLKTKPKRGLLQFLINRLLSFTTIVSLGFLLLVSLLVNTFLDLFLGRLEHYFAAFSVYFLYLFNTMVIFGTITCLFAVIFKVLPDGHLRWKDTFVGAGFTAFLFMIGKFIIGFYLSNSKIATTYGSASSIILILLWVYYSSIILYFGAEFTKVYAYHWGGKISPKSYALRIDKKEVIVEEG